jgi:hypothetical protein
MRVELSPATSADAGRNGRGAGGVNFFKRLCETYDLCANPTFGSGTWRR